MKKVGLVLLCVMMTVVIVLGVGGCKKETSDLEQMDMLSSALNLIKQHYIGELDIDELDFVAAEAVIDSLDQYTYLTDTYYTQSSNSNIGVSIRTNRYNEHFISNIVSGFPADEAFEDGFKLQRGDGITNSNLLDENGEPIFYRVRGLSRSYISTYTAGGEGTVLTLRIVRNGVLMGDYAYTKVTGYMPRAEFIADVYGDGSNVGYISLSSFTKTQMPDGTVMSAANDFKACMEQFIEANQTKLIVDLRANGGGSTDDLSIIASYFVPLESKGTTEILQLLYKKTGKTVSINVREDNYIPDLPLVILCDNNTASAAEAFIGACRAYNKNNTTVIGQETYGKGVFQKTEAIYDKTETSGATGILDQYYVVLVNGYYYIVDPSVEGGKYNIHEQPLKPDVEVVKDESIGALIDDAEMIAAYKAFFGE